MNLQKEFQKWCIDNNTSRTNIAKSLGVEVSAFSKWLDRSRRPNKENCIKLEKLKELTNGCFEKNHFFQ